MSRYQYITLIRPPAVTGKNTYSSPSTLSIGLAYISSALKENGYHVRTIDAIGEALDQVRHDDNSDYRITGLDNQQIIERISSATDMIGISCMFSVEWPIQKKLIQDIKKAFPYAKIILGGEHASSAWREILNTVPEVDLCVCGEGDETIIDIAKNKNADLKDIPGIAYRGERNRPIKNISRKRILKIDNIPRPDWSDIPLEKYFSQQNSWCPNIKEHRHISVIATRGCPYQCTFCSSPSMWTTRFSVRTPQNLMNEILYHVEKNKITGFDMSDLTAILKRDWIFEFTDLLIESGLKLSWTLPQGTRTEQFDRPLIKQLKRANLRYTTYCPESGSNRIVKRIKKKVNLKKMLKSMRIAKQEGLVVKTGFIIGFPFEKRIDVYKTLIFQIRCAFVGVDDSIIHFYCPYPGSEIFNQLYAENKISYDDNYYKSLINMMDLTKIDNYCEHINKYELGLYRIIGMATFYIVSYLTRPMRIIRTLRVFVVNDNPISLLELRLVSGLKLFKKIRAKDG